MNNRQKMVVKADQNTQKFLREAEKMRKTSQRRKATGKALSSTSGKRSA